MKKDPQRALEVLIFLGLVSLLLGLAKLILSGAPNKQPQAPEVECRDATPDRAEPEIKQKGQQ
jgi:hypothetical protein